MYTFRIYENEKLIDAYFTYRPFDIKKVCEAIAQKVWNANRAINTLRVIDEIGADWTSLVLHEIEIIEKDEVYITNYKEVEI